MTLILTLVCSAISVINQTDYCVKVMLLDPMKEHVIVVAVRVILHVLQAGPASVKGSCLTGGFFFAHGRNMVQNHALRGHVIANVTATEPIHCFRTCRLDCRCISFNYQHGVSQNNCQLNDENRYTNSSALEFLEGSQYHDLVIDYSITANVPFVECQNGCCESRPCLNGGTCHETCDVIGTRFACECGLHAIGKYCETALPTCYTADWVVTLDSPRWALCDTDNYRQPYLSGFWRRVNIGDGGLWLLEYGNCCGAALSSYVHQPVTCLDQNWDTVLNGFEVWALCPSGYYLSGIHTSGIQFLNQTEEAKCCRPPNHPNAYEDCYDEDVGLSFDEEGWSVCKQYGYYMAGFYKSDCEKLYCIERFRCCKML